MTKKLEKYLVGDVDALCLEVHDSVADLQIEGVHNPLQIVGVEQGVAHGHHRVWGVVNNNKKLIGKNKTATIASKGFFFYYIVILYFVIYYIITVIFSNLPAYRMA